MYVIADVFNVHILKLFGDIFWLASFRRGRNRAYNFIKFSTSFLMLAFFRLSSLKLKHITLSELRLFQAFKQVFLWISERNEPVFIL